MWRGKGIWSNIIQAGIGAFSSVLLFLALRGGNPLIFDAKIGFIITLAWVGIIYFYLPSHFKLNFWIDLVMTLLICYVLSKAFYLDVPLSFQIFGSTFIVAVWIALPIAVLFDYHNIFSILQRHYVRRRI